MARETPTPPDRRDWIMEAVIARVAELGVTAYAIAKACDGAVSENHILCYLGRRRSMGSHKLQHVLTALGLTIAPGVSPLGVNRC